MITLLNIVLYYTQYYTLKKVVDSDKRPYIGFTRTLHLSALVRHRQVDMYMKGSGFLSETFKHELRL